MSFRSVSLRARKATNYSAYATTTFAMARQYQTGKTPQPPSQLPVSGAAYKIKEEPGDELDDVVFDNKYGLRKILLNRPKKLNSLNGSMVRKIVPRMIEWEKSDMANVVVIKGAGDRAFCAGGDVATLADWNLVSADGWKQSADFFALEYKLNHYIATYQTPFISFMDGITMGGGVGLSIHAPLRVATERTVFAMPETTIGFFPDVGASFFLSRMNGAVGTYLALTSERLTGANVFYSGIATHYLHSASLPDLEARLGELHFRDDEPLERRLDLVNDTLEEFVTGLPPKGTEPMVLAGETRRAIDRCFGHDSVGKITAALEAEAEASTNSPKLREWAQKQLATLRKRSPTAVHVALRQMRTGGRWTIAEAFEREHQMAAKFMQHPDFSEGVTALLKEKRAPRWQPASLEEVAASGEDVTGPFFAFDDKEKLALLTERTFSDYPFPLLAVPTEKEIRRLLEAKVLTRGELIAHVVASRRGRQGIRKVVDEIIRRKVGVDAEGNAQWVEEEEISGSRL